MKITYDKEAEAAYIYFSEEKSFKTVRLNDQVLIDVDKAGKPVGVEILDLVLGPSALKSSFVELITT